ncbi:MAG: cytochrome c maturation protein CcmE [Coriobacteriales bacterium]|nr:cytochrome c maturation protein CcmE [Coriobacteriales bacterium]
MNKRLKRRLVVVTGVVVIVVLAILAVVNGTTSKTVTVEQAASGAYNGTKVQVTGKVVDNSYAIDGNTLSFSIYDDGAQAAASTDAQGVQGAQPAGRPQLKVIYDKGVSATFGNQVEAICTGVINDDGVLVCTELVTKCPSKYENSTDSLSVSQLWSYGESIIDKPVRISGALQAGTLKPVGQEDRFVLAGQDGGQNLPVVYEGALSDEVRDGAELVVTGALNSSGRFVATDVALRG